MASLKQAAILMSSGVSKIFKGGEF